MFSEEERYNNMRYEEHKICLQQYHQYSQREDDLSKEITKRCLDHLTYLLRNFRELFTIDEYNKMYNVVVIINNININTNNDDDNDDDDNNNNSRQQ
jgi:hypothetical protein